MVKVFTSRVSYNGTDRLDTTVKSGKGIGAIFAPTWDLVWDVKHGRITDAQYDEGYRALLRGRYAVNPAPFIEVLQTDEVTLCCYCAAGKHCHRLLLVDILEKVARKHEIEFIRGGER